MGENPPEEDFSKLSIEDLVVHKSWKARQTGYLKATSQFGTWEAKDPKFGGFLGIIKKFVEDSNVMALEKGLDAMLAFTENAAVAPKTAGEVCPVIVQKSIGNTKTKIKEKAQEIMMMFVEVEKQDVVIESLLAGLQNKNPKAVAACVDTIAMAVNQFGAKALGGVKNIASQLSPLLEHKDPNVRERTKVLAIELYRWVGAAFMPLLANLKPIQKTDLQAEFDAIKGEGAPIPCRYLRSQRASEPSGRRVEEGGSGEEAGGEVSQAGSSRAEAAPAMDPWDVLTPVDVIGKLPSDFYEQLESKKWSERKTPLDKLADQLKDQRLDPKANYGEIVAVLKRIVGKDSNILVVASAGACITGLALGLRKKFGNFAQMVTPVILEKFKEKKTAVVKSMTEAIDAVAKTTSLECLMEDIVIGLEHKSPTVKIQTSFFVMRLISSTTKENVPKKVLKALTAALIKVINDPDHEVRESGASALGAGMKMAGEKAFLPFIADIAEDRLKMERIKHFYVQHMEEAGSEIVTSMVQSVHKTLEAGDGGGGEEAGGAGRQARAGMRPPGRRTLPPGKGPVGGSKGDGPKGGPLKVQKAAKTRAGSAGRGTSATGKRPPTIPEGPKVPDEPEIAVEEAEERAGEIFPADALTELESAQWKERLTGVEKLSKMDGVGALKDGRRGVVLQVAQSMSASDVPTQILIRLLFKKKENNFQVLNQKLELLLFLARGCPFTACSFSLILGDVLDKIADSKHGAASKQILLGAAQALSLNHVSEKVMDCVMGLKNPKCQSETLLWLSGAVKEFGLEVNLKQAIDVAQKALSATNPGVRTAGVELAGVLYLFVGEKIRSYFQGEKSALLQALDGEFQKYGGQKPPIPTKKWKLSREVPTPHPAGGDNAGEVEDGMDEDDQDDSTDQDDIIPRKDISEQMTEELLEQMGDPAWKVREAALERVQGILSDAKFITGNLGGLPEALRARLGESNKNLAQVSLGICEQLARAVGPRIRIHVRTIAPGIIYLLGDGKATVRQKACNCLNVWVEQCGLKEFLDGEILPTAFKKTNPTLTAELLKWVVEKLGGYGKKKLPVADLKSCVPHLLSGLEDRNPEVRKQCQEAILPFMKVVGFEPMQRFCTDLKAPSCTTVQGILDKARTELSVSQPGKEGVPDMDLESEPSTARSATTAGTPKAKLGARGRSTSRKPGESARGKKDDDSFEGGALIHTQQKPQRFQEEKSMKILKWQFAVPSDELIEQLKGQLSSVCKPALLIQLFHSDFKQHLKAIEALNMSIVACPEAALGCSDLLLKWCTLRFFDTNPSVLLKCLDFIKQLQQLQLSEGDELHDYEVSSFVPFLLLKAGEPKEMVRAEVREILEKLCNLYPSSKLFPMIMEGLKTKNSRQKAECLMRMAAMVELYGPSVSGNPGVAFKTIAQNIGERDKDVRNGALTCLVAVFMHAGEKVYKYVGNISEKDGVMLEERIKRSSKNRPVIKKPSPAEGGGKTVEGGRGRTPVRGGGGAAVKTEVNGVDHDHSDEAMDTESESERGGGKRSGARSQGGMFRLDYEEIGGDSDDGVEYKMPKLIDHTEVDEILRKPVEFPEIRNRGISPAKRRASVTSVTSVGSVDASSTLDNVISQVTSSSIQTASQALAQLDELLKEGKNDVLVGKVDQILMALYFQLRMAYSTHMADTDIPKDEVVDLYRGLGAMLFSLLQHDELAGEASEGPLKDLACQLLTVLLDERLTRLPEGIHVVKAINLLIVKLVEKTDATVCLVALIRLLRETLHSQTASTKFHELVMKCIWKHSRRLSCISEGAQLTRTLTEAHLFFADFPTASWRQRKEDTPLRTVKTVLNTLVRLHRDKILDHVGGIENPQNSEMVAYLKKCLKEVAKLPPTDNKENPVNGEMATSSVDVLAESTNTQPVPEPQLPGSVPETSDKEAVLARIFKKIGDKENSKEGIRELYEMKRKNPGIKVDRFMNKSSSFFREYIERSLKQLESDRWAFNNNNNRPRGESPEVSGSMPSAYLEKLQQMRTKCGLEPSEVSVKRSSRKSEEEVSLPQVRMTASSSTKSHTPVKPLPSATSADLNDLKRRLDMIKRQQ